MGITDSFVDDIVERIALESSCPPRHNNPATYKDIQTAVRLLLLGELRVALAAQQQEPLPQNFTSSAPLAADCSRTQPLIMNRYATKNTVAE
ncbi:histone H2B-like isoform X1 [Tachysurus fulvidraco]|uniref:histone H2B-like isoform X1 n=1 Tax=Tachysurus fulvidraco TaxID=1234273 RepID=UPI001FEE8D3E|nr:histone H2B-like isoform X1 [Tachysurus fulvidraco]XP_047657415.1 histone H2B-like isoform X1 [Tachysurus fulvidraco]